MKIIYWYSIENGMTVTTGVPFEDEVAERACKLWNKEISWLYHYTVRYFPAV